MQRGDLVIVSAQGDYGKPRPAVVIQNDRLLDQIDSVTGCFITSKVVPDGLREPSQVQIEKIMTFPREKVRGPIGKLGVDQLRDVDRHFVMFLDLLAPLDIRLPK